LIQADGKKKEQ
jgi:signal transduction protein with GAF and PtsI domain